MKKIIKLIVKIINYCRVSFFDFRRYFFWAVNLDNTTDSLEGKIVKLTHALEKRLSFENPDPLYGKSKVLQLIDLISKYEVKKDKNDSIVDWSVYVVSQMINTYLNENEKKLFQVKTKNIAAFNNLKSDKSNGGYFTVKKKSTADTNFFSFKDFAFTRHSTRSFDGPVPYNKIKEAIEISLKSPSNCNLQPIRVYLIERKELLLKALSLQRGNSGFTDKIPQLIVYTAKLSLYSGFRERNQFFIDGGIFTMSMCYSFHHLGYGSCFLNWASTVKEEKKMKALLNIPKDEIIIVTMAIGQIPDNFKVPYSQRRDVNSIIKLF